MHLICVSSLVHHLMDIFKNILLLSPLLWALLENLILKFQLFFLSEMFIKTNFKIFTCHLRYLSKILY